MFRSWKIGTAFGIGIFIHPTFWLLPLFTVLRVRSGGTDLVVLVLGLLAAAMSCVVLHELGHALMARYFGIRTRDITLYPIGGVARLERLGERPIEELFIALAGPAVNVAIAAFLLPFVLVTNLNPWLVELSGPAISVFLSTLLAINVWLVLFNLIPAFPMDGGRVLRAVLAMSLGKPRATEIAAKIGLVMAILLAASYFLLGHVYAELDNPMLVLVAGFIALVGRQELAMVRHQEAVRRAREAEPQVVSAEPIVSEVTGAPIQPGFSGFQWDGQLRAWVLWRDGRPVATYGAGPE